MHIPYPVHLLSALPNDFRFRLWNRASGLVQYREGKHKVALGGFAFSSCFRIALEGEKNHKRPLMLPNTYCRFRNNMFLAPIILTAVVGKLLLLNSGVTLLPLLVK